MTYARRIVAGAFLAGGFIGAASAGAPVGEAAWLRADADIVRFLTTAPGECLREPATKEDRYRVAVGRAAFRSPLLLGGTAARGGLSCNTCHRDGAGNPDFFLEGLSGAPGTADVTSSLFSKVREDGAFNPLPIPSLIGAAERTSFGTGKKAHDLEAFVGAAVVDEFEGSPPPASVLDGLAAYISHLDATRCPAEPRRVTVRAAMRDAERAIRTAEAALERGDAAAADFDILAAQQELGRVHERFSAGGATQNLAALEALSRKLAGIRAIAAASPKGARFRLDEATLDARRLAWRLHADRRQSLFDADALRGALERPVAGSPPAIELASERD